jgi:chromosome segregation protein
VTVRFTALRLSGFKSFAEPVTLEIRPGLTGIIGPNGCGKSNVVDALRWVMGEGSARSLRGGEMDDVIFAGTHTRPPRAFAEVTLRLEDAKGLAPPPFHGEAELEVTRRLERGAGSLFRINGREVRARDVQTLFADLASGARASAIVGQDRVSALIAARPEDRRALLEEAAGIGGLYARRHEAELKLRAAEANLARLEDVRGVEEAELARLRRQARQAQRYRTLQTAIRQTEAALLARLRSEAEAALAEAEAAFAARKDEVAEAARAAETARAEQAEAEAALARLREETAERRGALERHRLLLDQAKRAVAEAAARRAALLAKERETAGDAAHAARLIADAEASLARLAEEEARLGAEEAAEAGREAELRARLAAATAALGAAEARAEEAGRALMAAETTARVAEEALKSLGRRREAIIARLEALRAERARLAPPSDERLAAAEAEVAGMEAALGAARAALAALEAARPGLEDELAACRAAAEEARATLGRLVSEAEGLAALLAAAGDGEGGIFDHLAVPAGLEAAFAAAFADSLAASDDTGAPRHWRALPPFSAPPELPPGVTPLTARLSAFPPVLSRALAGIGLVASAEEGERRQAELAPGTALVSPDGGLWRADGFTIRPGTPSAAAVRLAQRNRLAALEEAVKAAEAAREAAERRLTEAASREAAHRTEERQSRAAVKELEGRREAAVRTLRQLRLEAETAAGRAKLLAEEEERLAAERAEIEARLAAARAEREAAGDLAALRSAREAAAAALGAARRDEAAARTGLAEHGRRQQARRDRLRALAGEREAWQRRLGEARSRAEELARRAAELVEARAALGGEGPAEAELERLRSEAAAVEQEAAAALAALTEAEATARRAAAARERAEERFAAAREALVRAEGEQTRAREALGAVLEQIVARFGAADPAAQAGEVSGDAAALKARLDRLLREREGLGPVNLRAEIEAQEIEERIARLEREKEELSEAIAKLRGSIAHLNREGRERLTRVFTAVDREFQALFARMFGGGRAHLALVGAEDPLEAGLEIFAQPPGKKLTRLSLLSGGEQALTAISLIFAVFRCNPAPIVVLDEVDAPLDDVNVGRFCALLRDLAAEGETRVLIVTHHHLTMAHMDRLFGVTMPERGVSRLYSVDLAAAAAMLAKAKSAA